MHMTIIHVFCSIAVERVMLECISSYERETGVRITVAFGTTADLRQEIERGARGDLAVLTREALDDLANRAIVIPSTRVGLARSGIAVAVRAGHPKPAIDTPAAFTHALLAARSVAHSKRGVGGIYFAQLIDQLGITAEMRGRLVVVDGKLTGEAVAAGEAELGIQQLSELLTVSGIDIVGSLPGDLQKLTVFEAAVLSCASDKEGATALLSHIAATSPALLQRHGLIGR
jgi:molybdate transport system substrate-binding protein